MATKVQVRIKPNTPEARAKELARRSGIANPVEICTRGLTPEQEASRERLKQKIKKKKIDPKRQALQKLIEAL